MPLKKGTSDKTRSQNIAEMVKAGRPAPEGQRAAQKQAVAAAYRQQAASNLAARSSRSSETSSKAKGKK